MTKQRLAPAAWNQHTFRAWFDDVFHGESIAVLANRQPVVRDRAPGSAAMPGSSSGLLTALEPLTSVGRVLWVARGDDSPPTDGMVHRSAESPAPPASSRLHLRRVSVPPQVQAGHYDGFCNEGLWPLCHRTSVHPTFREHDFQMYKSANAQWAVALCEEVNSDSPVVLVQDYHLALAPKLIRERLPRATLVAFWHVPFPSPGTLSACPWERELLEGLLGSSIVGFQTTEDRKNFLDATICVLGAHVDREKHIVSYSDHRTHVRVYPASVAWPNPWARQTASVEVCRAVVRRRFCLAPDTQMLVGIDRLDYTKGLVQKLLAVERLLATRPEFRGKAVLLQVAEPSRAGLPAYREYRAHLYRTADRINQRFGARGYAPIVLHERHVDTQEVFELLRAGDICYVGSLHDGMNLVSKEFVTAREDERGVLVLSEFTGAARELSEALAINPFATDDCAIALDRALRMPATEQAKRMQSLRAVVQAANSYKWAGDMLGDAASMRRQPYKNRGAREPVATPSTVARL